MACILWIFPNLLPCYIGFSTDYPFKGYNHSGWLSENNIYVFADENHGYKLKVCDVSNVNEIQVLSTILSEVDDNSIAHNIVINENLLYVSITMMGFGFGI